MQRRKNPDADRLGREWDALRQRFAASGVSAADLAEWATIDYPVFSFRYLSPHSLEACRDAGFLTQFLMRLRKLSELGWKQIMLADRHGFGAEQIPIRQLKRQHLMPGLDDDGTLTVFRAAGNNLPFVGKRRGNLFYILFIETSFGDVYDHG